VHKLGQKAVLAGLVAATLVAVGAQAQDNPSDHHDLRRDRNDWREVNRDDRSGEPCQVSDDRRDANGARLENLRDRRDAARDWGRDHWGHYRNQNRDICHGAGWRSAFRYQAFRRAIRITLGNYAPRYYIDDYAGYRLPRPGWNQRGVRHYNDVLLIDRRSGIVIDVIPNSYW